MPLSKKDVTVLLRIAVAGKPFCLVEVRLLETRDRKERFLAFVPGNADAMGIDAIFYKKVSRLTYFMDLAAGWAKIADVGTNPDFQRYHLQQSLFAYALKDLLAKGIKTAGLRWKGGKAAYDLYFKLGFRFVDKETKDMELRLSEHLVRKIYVRTEAERKEALRKYDQSSHERKAIFTGDFDPFHLGHAYAIEKGLELADKVLVYVSDRRGQLTDPKTRRSMIRKYIRLKGLYERVRVYDGAKKSLQLTNEGYSIKICGSDLFTRNKDLMPKHIEQIMAAKELIILTRPAHKSPADIWKIKDHFEKLGKIVHIIPPRKDVAELSSTGVGSLLAQSKPITGFVPPEIEEDIIKIYAPIWAGCG